MTVKFKGDKGEVIVKNYMLNWLEPAEAAFEGAEVQRELYQIGPYKIIRLRYIGKPLSEIVNEGITMFSKKTLAELDRTD